MTQFNPNEPHAIGMEWFPFIEVNPYIDLNAAAILTASETESINKAYIYLLIGAGDGGGYEMEVWNLNTLNASTFNKTTLTYRPDTDVDTVRASKWDGSSLSTSALYEEINETSVDPNNWIQPTNLGDSFEVSFRYAALAGTLSNRHITEVRLTAWVQGSTDDGGSAPIVVKPYLKIGGARFFGDTTTFTEDAEVGHRTTYTWRANPATGATWTPSDLNAFDTGTSSAGWRIEPTSRTSVTTKLLQGYMEVVHVGTDKRTAKGSLDESELGWSLFNLRNPLTGSSWTKTAGQQYLFLLTRYRATGRVAWRFMDSLIGPVSEFRSSPQQTPARGGSPIAGPPFWTSGRVKSSPDSALPIRPVTDVDRSGAYGILLGTSGGDISADSQPYVSLWDDGVSGPQLRGRILQGNAGVSQYRPWTRVQQCSDITGESTQIIEQELTPSETGDYGFLRVVVQVFPASDGTIPQDLAPLQVRVYDRSTDTLQSGVMEIDMDDLEPGRTREPQVVAKRFPGGTFQLDASTQYYLRFETQAVAGEGSWRVQVASPLPADVRNAPPAGIEAASYGQDIDRYRIASNPAQTFDGEYGELATLAVLHTVPDAPTGFNVSTTTEPVGLEACETGDLDDAINYSEIVWDVVSIPEDEGGGFAYYEIERDDDDGAGFQVIGRITDPTCTSAEDHEAAVGLPTYRMRAVREDGSPSDWTTEVQVEIVMTACGYAYTSNLVPELGVWYDDLTPRSYTFLENREYLQFHGRNFGVEYTEEEDRGDEFEVAAVINFGEPRGEPLAVEGRRLFDPLLILSGNKRDPDTRQKITLPYVCVRDRDGNRWFAALGCGPGERVEPLKRYTMPVRVRESTDVPAPFDKECTPDSGSGSGCPVSLGSGA